MKVEFEVPKVERNVIITLSESEAISLKRLLGYSTVSERHQIMKNEFSDYNDEDIIYIATTLHNLFENQ